MATGRSGGTTGLERNDGKEGATRQSHCAWKRTSVRFSRTRDFPRRDIHARALCALSAHIHGRTRAEKRTRAYFTPR